MLTVKFKKLNPDVKLPVKGSSHAACYDVYADSIKINDNKAVVGLGFATEFPAGWKGVIVPRSNLTKYKWVLNNSMGVIDCDYRGEWKAIFTSIGDNDWFPYSVGERIAQIYFDKVEDVTFVESEELNDSSRGTGGFGSSGLT
jgi:dUTP pyrophosphatase